MFLWTTLQGLFPSAITTSKVPDHVCIYNLGPWVTMKNRILLPTHHSQIAWARNKALLFLKPLGIILGAPQQVQYHRPLGFLTEKNLARGKVMDKKWFTRVGHLWG